VRDAEIVTRLEQRLGTVHARQRLGIEREHEARVFGGSLTFFHLENWYSAHKFIRNSLKLVGLYNRASRNALDIRVVHNRIALPGLPEGLDGLRLLHLSDLHIDMSEALVHEITARVRSVEYDVCVMTGDYRFRTYGGFDAVIDGMRRVRAQLNGPAFAVLGNHDSVTMLPELEEMGIRVLMNESVNVGTATDSLHLAGIDDAHYFGVGNIEKALAGVPDGEAVVLLSHTPEVYRQAAHAGIHLMLCGHTHGGQICLPGGLPVTLDARIPRRLGRGNWRHAEMHGYTSPGAGASVVGVRLNCPPEITVHELRAVPGSGRPQRGPAQ
jgi:predicted MPP superfamily phosphohydrolase